MRTHQKASNQQVTAANNSGNNAADITEDISESSLPPRAGRAANATNAHDDSYNLETSITDPAVAETSMTTLMQKEYAVDNMWRGLSMIHDSRTQRNYERVVHKRTLSEIEEFEAKVETWMKEYRDFVDDGISRKQIRF